MMNDTICPPDSICLIRLSAIGDVCHVTAVVQGIQSRYPATKITWIIGRVEYELLRDLPGVEFVVFDKGQGLAAYRDVRKKLSDREPFDLLLHMQTSFRSNLLASLINAHKKIGFPRAKSRELHSLVVNARIQDQGDFHVLDVFKGFAQFIGICDFDPHWNIPIPSPAAEKSIALVPKDKGAVVIAPSASNPERNWLPERYAEVADFCVDKGFDVIVTGGPASSDVEMANSICRQARHAPINMAGQTSLKELLAICRRARLVIGPDSGTLHMATTQNTPVVGLYAHSNPKRTGPYLSIDSVVDVYNSSLDELGVPPEKRQWGLRLKGKGLMEAISVSMVIDSITPFLEDQSLPT